MCHRVRQVAELSSYAACKHEYQRTEDIEGGPSLSLFPASPSPHDCVAVIAGVQHFHGPMQVKYCECPDPCDPCGVDADACKLCRHHGEMK